MRLALLFAALTAAAAEPGYVDPAVCRPCHQAIYDTYSRTGMGRSFAPAITVPPLAGFTHERSARSYSVVNRGGSPYLRRTHEYGVIEKRIDYVLGSGNHSKTFVHKDDRGRLWELPVSWYAERGGYWAMSPGYDRPDHSDFRRELSDSCLFCHNGYPSAANKGLASGIDCQRCHGPGEAHVQSSGAILNPATLSRDRQMDVCVQCHLESASRTLPEAIRRFERTPFSYRPGEPLAEFKLYFQFAGEPESEDRITVNNSAYGLRQSPCFMKSKALTCTTCHNAHQALRGEPAEKHYTAACRSCHATSHTLETTGCAACHMPKRRTEDAVHVVMTDHRIRRRPPPGDFLAPLAERTDKRKGPIKPLYTSANSGARLYSAITQIAVSNDLSEDTRKLEQAIRAERPRHALPYRTLAEAFRQTSRSSEAIRAYRNALQFDPADEPSLIGLSQLAQATTAIPLLESALKRSPDSVSLRNALAVIYAGQNRFTEAAALLSKALEILPDDPISWLNLGVCLQAKGDTNGAEAAYRQALLLQPDLSKAKANLQALH